MKFNFRIKAEKATVNHEGALAYRLTPEMELYAAIATTFMGDISYESADSRLQRVRSLLPRVSPVFIAKLAVYARSEMNLRTAPLILATELARLHKGDNLVSKTVEKIIQRPDEIMEMLACYQAINERKGVKKLNSLSKQLQKGLAASFNHFDEYQFAKYNRSAEVKLKDALFLVHPKAATESQQLLFNKIVNDELATPYTWETELSELGKQKFESKEQKQLAVKAKWEELVDSGKLGYMALLRNLRNMLEAGVGKQHIEKIAAVLADEQAVLKSRQLPFRFLSAYRELKSVQNGYTGYIMEALERAIIASVENLQGFDADTRVVIACDVSGSMQTAVSAKSSVLLYDIGLLMGMLLQSKCKHVLSGMFGDTWKTVSLPRKPVLSNVDAFYKREGEVGYSTNGFLVIQNLIAKKYIADKVVFFTDVQMWSSVSANNAAVDTVAWQWKQYKKMAPGAKLYLFDLAGHGTSPVQMVGDDVCLIAGWSDKVFAMMDAMDKGVNAVDIIESIEI